MAQDANRPLVFGSQLIGVLIVVMTLLTRQVELRSTRPVGDKKLSAAQPDENGDYFARLWDDPLAPLPTFQVGPQEKQDAAAKTVAPSGNMQAQVDKSSPASSPGPNALPTIESSSGATTPPGRQDQKASQMIATTAQEKGLFVWNILDARPLPEIKERRLRVRYAVVSALVAEGYLPANESLLIPLGSPAIGYYETFRSSPSDSQKSDAFKYVTVIWIPKQLPEPNSAFNADFRKKLQQQIADQSHVSADGAVRLLHHGSSEDFGTYLSDPKRTETNISFMQATIPQRHLRNPDSSRVQSIRRVTPDDQLVPALIGELCLRIPSLNRVQAEARRPRVIICTESDTHYSRAIASDVTAALAPFARVEVYSYLRGLDGRLEDTPTRTKSEQTPKSDIAASLLHGKAISESSLGTSQFDYLRRLSLYLEQQKKKKKTEGEICAVGILGTDIYDKMLVLQAIRPQLGAASFFTTDLDALYLEQGNETFTRNLIVASADSLDVNAGRASGAQTWRLPPMRDSYQTVLVKHMWEILDAGKAELPPMAAKPVHVFEIVAGKSIELQSVDAANFWGKSSLAWLPVWGNIVIFLLALGNAFLVLWAISTREVRPPEMDTAPMNGGARIFAYSEIAVALGFLIFLLYKFISPVGFFGEEPMNLEASVWPSITIRLLAFAVAIRLLMIASNAFVVHSSRLEEELRKATPSDEKLPLSEGALKEMAATCMALVAEKAPPLREKTFEQVLKKHFDKNARRKRIMWASLGYLAFSFVLFACWPPAVPARGAFTFLVEKVVLALGVGLYIIHLMYCLDLHISACTLLRTLRSFYSPAVQKAIRDRPVETNSMLNAASELTAIIGKTLLYPLTILILIIISRLRIFDNWTMTPSLSVTFLAGAAGLVLASLVLWYEGALLRSAVLKHKERKAHEDEAPDIDLITDGAFAPWHRQPLFAAIFSTAAVFGSLTVAEPLLRLFFGSA